MFVGRHEHSLDPKGRVVVPASFRSVVVDHGYVTTLGVCIGLWDAAGFAAIAEDLKRLMSEGKLSHDNFRQIMGDARQVNLDTAGRITLPRELLDRLGFDKDVVISGRMDRVEIWPAAVHAEKFPVAKRNNELADIDNLGL